MTPAACYVVAVIAFGLAAAGVPCRGSWRDVGYACLTLSLIV